MLVSLYMNGALFPARAAQAILDSASAGRRRAARQPPKAPATRPPRTARPTARRIAVRVTGADRCTATVEAASAAARVKPAPRAPAPLGGKFPPPKPPPPPPKRAAPPGVALPVVLPREALSEPEKRSTSWAPTKPRATPTTPPTTPMAMDSPMTWPTTRRERQPRALRVPNSRMRRDTADMVSRLASRNAAMRTAIARYRPRLLASEEALDREPVTSLARLLSSVTVEPETVDLMLAASESMSLLLVAET